MGFKDKYKLAKIRKIKAKTYVKDLAVYLKTELKNGTTVPFKMLLTHKFPDLSDDKNKRLPLLMLGPLDSAWKTYHTEDKGAQKKKMVSGTVRRNEDELVFDIDGSRGLTRIPRQSIQFLGLLLKKINKNMTINTTGGSGGVIDEKLNENKAEQINQETKNMDGEVMRDLKNSQEVTEYKEQKQEEAQELYEEFKGLEKMIDSALKKVNKNIKKQESTKEDIDHVKEAEKAFLKIETLYNGTAKQVQGKFTAPYKKLQSKSKKFKTLFKWAEKKEKVTKYKNTDAYRLAEQYAKVKKQEVNLELVKEVQKTIKKVSAMNKKRGKRKVNAKLMLRATFYVLKKTGLKNFNVKYVNLIFHKQKTA